MSRYGDTPEGMVESCMEYLRICMEEQFKDVVISIKASNASVMVRTVRLLVDMMNREGMNFPLHLGVTEAGEGEDGRIKSALGIGALLADGYGDTIRVSLSEAPEAEIPVARKLRDYVTARQLHLPIQAATAPSFDYLHPVRRETKPVHNIGGKQVPVVIAARFSEPYTFNPDFMPDYVYVGRNLPAARRADVQYIVDADAFEVSIPVDEGIVGLERGYVGGVVLRGDVAQAHAVPIVLGKLGLECHYVLGGSLGIFLRVARHCEDILQILHVLGANLFHIALVAEVIVAVGESEAGLGDVEGVDVGVEHIGLHATAEEWATYAGVLPYHHVGELRALHRVDELEVGLYGVGAFAVETHAIHTEEVYVAHLLPYRAFGLLRCGELVEKVSELLAVVLAELIEGAET